MALKYDTAASMAGTNLLVKILLMGRSGAGKSWLGATAVADGGKIAVLLTEANGLASITRCNPDAIVVRAYDPAAYGKTTSFEVVQEFILDAHSGVLANLGVKSIVIDSATEIQRIIRGQILREKDQHKNPGYQFSQQDWGLLTERMRRFARTVRDLPYHVVFITLSDEKVSEDEGIDYVRPSFEGQKLPGEIAQFFSAVGYVFKRQITRPKADGSGDEKVTEHAVLFQGPSRYVVKPVHPLRDVEVANVADWIRRIREVPATPHAAPTTATSQAAPAPSPPVQPPAQPASDAGSTTSSSPAADAAPSPGAPADTSPPATSNADAGGASQPAQAGGAQPVVTTRTRRTAQKPATPKGDDALPGVGG